MGSGRTGEEVEGGGLAMEAYDGGGSRLSSVSAEVGAAGWRSSSSIKQPSGDPDPPRFKSDASKSAELSASAVLAGSGVVASGRKGIRSGGTSSEMSWRRRLTHHSLKRVSLIKI